jgi:hypothetical protein
VNLKAGPLSLTRQFSSNLSWCSTITTSQSWPVVFREWGNRKTSKGRMKLKRSTVPAHCHQPLDIAQQRPYISFPYRSGVVVSAVLGLSSKAWDELGTVGYHVVDCSMDGFTARLKLSVDVLLFPLEAGRFRHPAAHYDFPKNHCRPSANNIETGQLI